MTPTLVKLGGVRTPKVGVVIRRFRCEDQDRALGDEGVWDGAILERLAVGELDGWVEAENLVADC